MKLCNRCGTDNTDNSRFCKGCGYELPKPVQVEQPVVAPPRKKSKKKLFIGIGIVAVLAIITCIGFGVVYAGKHFLKSAQVTDTVLTKMADEMNKICPMMIDQYIRLDKGTALPEKKFQYDFTIVGIATEQIDSLAFKSEMEPNIVTNLQQNPQLVLFREMGVKIDYIYRTEAGEYWCKITIEPEQYKN